MTDIYRLKTGTFIAIAESQVPTFLGKILQRFKNHYPSDNTIRLSNNPPQIILLGSSTLASGYCGIMGECSMFMN